jgi:polysaccharide biosynthesis protein PelF
MRVALIAEGTYPHQFGGVSVWCDQLIRGLPQYDFAVIPVIATGNEAMRWELPGNVSSVTPIPLWGRPPAVPLRSRLSAGRDHSLLPELIDVLLSPPAEMQDRFTNVMHELLSYARARNLRALLSSETAVRLLGGAWRQRWPEILPRTAAALEPCGPEEADPGCIVPTVGDAVVAMQLLEHALRPFSHAPAQADLVHAVTNGLAVLPAVASKWQYGLPMIVTEHGVYLREHYLHLRRPQFGWPVKDLYLRFLRRLCALGYQEADVITPGNVYNKRWEAVLGADTSRIRTVYNGVDPAAFPVLTGEPAVPTISWVGRIDPIKDVLTLLRAFSLVIKEIPQARLRIFGSPPPGEQAYLERCQAEAADLGLGDLATFEGRVADIRDAYAAGQVFVLCSRSEGFPYALIEAMTCGRACVATDVGGVSEAVGDDAGLIVPPRNPAALADACVRLLRDGSLRQALGTAARARALAHFTVDRTISAFDELYTLLGSGSREAAAAAAVPADGAQGTVAAPAAGETAQAADEDATVILPQVDEEIAQLLPASGGSAALYPGHSPTLPRPADQDATVVLPRIIAAFDRPPDREEDGLSPGMSTEALR